MRKALNSNPMVQIAVVGVLVLVVGLFVMTTMGKKSGSGSPASSSTSAGSSPSGATTAPVTVPDGTAQAGAAGVGATVAPSAGGGTVTPAALIPGPGLPKDVVTAWKGGDTIALLIVRGRGIDDRMVRSSVEALSSEPNVSVFVARAQHVARYARITQGVGVDHVPALVVVR